MQAVEQLAYGLVDRGLVPDIVLRKAVRTLTRQRLREIERGSFSANHEAKIAFVELLRSRDIAIEQSKANEQHYEVSTEFIQSCLGPWMKYSSCLFPTGDETLEEAEICMLESYCIKAKLQDGMDILDLGCGWGSLCLYLARKYPNSRISALSNSSTQKLHIDATAQERKLTNLEVHTGDVMTYDFVGHKSYVTNYGAGHVRLRWPSFDRILSIEMFEHMKNYEMLLSKIATWLKPRSQAQGQDGALLFVHIFCHRSQPYDFLQDDGWMAQNFFSGGTMPSFDLFTYFQRDLVLQRSWWIPGLHYAKTLEAWLVLQDRNGARFLSGDRKLLEGKGAADGRVMFYRFRLFFLACAEFFALDNGDQYGVGHYLFSKRE